MTIEVRGVKVAMAASVAESVNPRVQECFGEIVACVRCGFTGTLAIDWKDGVPLSVKVTKSRRLKGGEP